MAEWPRCHYRFLRLYLSSKTCQRECSLLLARLALRLTMTSPVLGCRKGFWLSNWTRTHTEERIEMMNQLAKLCSTGQLKEPETEIVDLPPDVEGITTKIRSVMERSEGGKGKKILLRFC